MPLGLRLRHMVGRYVPGLRLGPGPDRQAVFALRPVRNSAIEWTVDDAGEAQLTIPRRKDRVGKFVGAWFRLPEAHAVQLDEVGSYVWSLCDGEHTVESIVRQTSRHYKMNRREVEVSVTTYLQMLAERKFIGFYQRGSKKT